jgi:hypothetical protein
LNTDSQPCNPNCNYPCGEDQKNIGGLVLYLLDADFLRKVALVIEEDWKKEKGLRTESETLEY